MTAESRIAAWRESLTRRTKVPIEAPRTVSKARTAPGSHAGVRRKRPSKAAASSKLAQSTAMAGRYPAGPMPVSNAPTTSAPNPKVAPRTMATTVNGRSFGPSPLTSATKPNGAL